MTDQHQPVSGEVEMSEQDQVERRRARRVDAQLAIQLHISLPDLDGPTELETINVSSTGVYFRSKPYIEPMTKLALNFDVRVDAETDETKTVNCEGIVARVVPEIPDDATDAYEVAVFFTTIDAESLENLERYIGLRLTP